MTWRRGTLLDWISVCWMVVAGTQLTLAPRDSGRLRSR